MEDIKIQSREKNVHLEYGCSFVCSAEEEYLYLLCNQDLATHVKVRSGARLITFLQTEAAVKIIEMLSTYCSILQ